MAYASWLDRARDTIASVHAGLPDDATLAGRIAAVDAAYPFGERAYTPYKRWLRARREYLERYGHAPTSGRLVESPLERMKRRAGDAAHATMARLAGPSA